MLEKPQPKRGRGRPPSTGPRKRYMVAANVGEALKRRLAVQAAHEGRSQQEIVGQALAEYLESCPPPAAGN